MFLTCGFLAPEPLHSNTYTQPYNGVNIICMKFYISMVADVRATPETQLLRTHNSSLQYFIVLFLLLANLRLSKLVVFLDQLTVFRLPRSAAAKGAKVCI